MTYIGKLAHNNIKGFKGNNMPTVYLGNLGPEVDYLALLAELSHYRSPLDKITGLVEDGDLIRVSRGIYVLGSKYKRPYSKFVLANRIVGPSCISAESALSYYGAIPEVVQTVTSVTVKRSKKVSSDVGFFEYFHLPYKAYSTGLSSIEVRADTKVFMATPEKSLIDLLVRQKSIDNDEQLDQYLNGLRIDPIFMKDLNLKKLLFLQTSYRSKIIDLFINYWCRLC